MQPIEQQHVEQCVELFLKVFNNPPWSEDWPLGAATTRLMDLHNTPGFYGVMAVDAPEVVGFAAGSVEQWDRAKHFYLKEMCVAPHRQRQYIGTTIMQALCSELATVGVERIYLLTACDSPAEHFYRKSGFYVSQKMIMMGKSLKG